MLQDEIELDFKRHLIEHENMSGSEVITMWDNVGEDYLEEVYQAMSDNIVHFVNRYYEQEEKDEI